MIPVVIAAFVAIATRPLYKRLAEGRSRWIRGLAAVAAVVAAFLILGAVAAAVVFAALPAFEQAPAYADQIEDRWGEAVVWMKNRNIPLPSEAAAAGSARRFLVETVAAAVGSFWSIAGGAVVVLFLAVLILLDVPSWAASAADGWTAGAGEAVLDVVRSIGGQLRAYFAVHALLAACAGVIEAAFLWAIGVDFAPLWGLLVFVFSFVPNFGAFVASGPPVLLAWVSLGWEWALAVGAGLTAIEVLLGNVAAPFVEGRRLIVSPLTVLASVVFWTWMWGPAGAFLAAPLTASMVVVMAHVESTRPFALMLSRRTEMERLLADALQQQAAT